MENVLNLFQGFSVILSWYNIGMMMVGLILGVLVGVLPGLGGPNGVAILLPANSHENLPLSCLINLPTYNPLSFEIYR